MNTSNPDPKIVDFATPGQWWRLSSGSKPSIAFSVTTDCMRLLNTFILSTTLDGGADDRVSRYAGTLFDACWGSIAHALAERAASCRRRAGALEPVRAHAHSELLNENQLEPDPNPAPAWPKLFTPRWWGMLAFAACFAGSAAGAAAMVITRLLPVTQSIPLALPMALVWVLVAVAFKAGLARAPRRARQIAYWMLAFVFAGGVGAWLHGMQLAGRGIDGGADEIFIGQLMADLPASVTFMCACTSMFGAVMVRRSAAFEIREEILIEATTDVETASNDAAKNEGDLKAMQASRLAFVSHALMLLDLRRQSEADAAARRALFTALMAA